MASLATLGNLVWRINPEEIAWNFEVFTNVTNTIGGRVVQITGAHLSDIMVRGQYGENRFTTVASKDTSENSPGRSWKMADKFNLEIRRIMRQQSPASNATTGILSPKPIRFYYPPRNWDFMVYVKSIKDVAGDDAFAAVTGKFSFGYQLLLVPIQDNTHKLTGDRKNTDLQAAKDAAIVKAIARISDGVGWKKTGFNDPNLHTNYYGDTVDGQPVNDTGKDGTPAADPADPNATGSSNGPNSGLGDSPGSAPVTTLPGPGHGSPGDTTTPETEVPGG
jgi:hypothetical protein